jgi:riboflavin kinase/FMN adenylyltransferase
MMRVYRSFENLPPSARGAVIAMGNFDGVHRGHRAVFSRACALADEMGVPVAALVFEPHPRAFFQPDAPDFRLTPLDVKARLLAEAGVDILFALPFDRQLASLAPADFVIRVLVEGMQAVHLVIGDNFRFGKGRAGDVAVLAHMAEMEGFGLTVLEPVTAGAGTPACSSTRIREALMAGRPEEAAHMLGRPWQIEGAVISGDKRGRTIGVPTANVAMAGYLKPKLGVYTVTVDVLDGAHKGRYGGVANIGRRPTFGDSETGLEAHLFDFSGDLYGTRIAVSLIAFLREERAFDGLDALKAQIAEDIAAARALLEDLESSAAPKGRAGANG